MDASEVNSIEKRKQEAMYARILKKFDELSAAMDRILGSPAPSSAAPATLPVSIAVVSSPVQTNSVDAHQVFDEMPRHLEATTGGVLRVIVSHALYPVTMEVLHQVFGPYGAEEGACVFEAATHGEAVISFRSYPDALRAREALHGRCIYDGCCLLDISCVQPCSGDCTSVTPTMCSTSSPGHGTSKPTATTSPEIGSASPSTTSMVAATSSLTSSVSKLPSVDDVPLGTKPIAAALSILSKGTSRPVVKWVSGVRITRRPVCWAMKSKDVEVLTHVGGVSLFVESTVQALQEKSDMILGCKKHELHGAMDDADQLFGKMLKTAREDELTSRWCLHRPSGGAWSCNMHPLAVGDIELTSKLRTDQETRSIDNHGRMVLDWVKSGKKQVSKEIFPWERSNFSPWINLAQNAHHLFNKTSSWERNGFSPGLGEQQQELNIAMDLYKQWDPGILHFTIMSGQTMMGILPSLLLIVQQFTELFAFHLHITSSYDQKNSVPGVSSCLHWEHVIRMQGINDEVLALISSVGGIDLIVFMPRTLIELKSWQPQKEMVQLLEPWPLYPQIYVDLLKWFLNCARFKQMEMINLAAPIDMRNQCKEISSNVFNPENYGTIKDVRGARVRGEVLLQSMNWTVKDVRSDVSQLYTRLLQVVHFQSHCYIDLIRPWDPGIQNTIRSSVEASILKNCCCKLFQHQLGGKLIFPGEDNVMPGSPDIWDQRMETCLCYDLGLWTMGPTGQ